MTNEFREITPEGVTDMNKKKRHTKILFTLIMSAFILFSVGIYVNYEMFLLGGALLIVSVFLLSIYRVFTYTNTRVNIGSDDQEFYCSQKSSYKNQIIVLTFWFLFALGTLIYVLTIFDGELNTIIVLITILLTVIISVWGLYKLGQKKTCDEFPQSWLEPPKPKEES